MIATTGIGIMFAIEVGEWSLGDRGHGLVATSLKSRLAPEAGPSTNSDEVAVRPWNGVDSVDLNFASSWAHDDSRRRSRQYGDTDTRGSIGRSQSALRSDQGRVTPVERGGRSRGEVLWRGCDMEKSAGFSAHSGPSQRGVIEVQHQGSLILTGAEGAGAWGMFCPP